jgi:hypothetical protein
MPQLHPLNTKQNKDYTAAHLSIKFGNNHYKYMSLDSNSISTINASKVVTVTKVNHGLSTGDVIDLKLTAAVNLIDDEADAAITVIDANTFTYTNSGPAANATGTGGAATDGIALNANVSRCYDLLDGNILNINGISFTAKNTDIRELNYTGALGQIKTKTSQTAEELAFEVKNAIKYYISHKGSCFEKLLGVDIKINPNDSSEIIFIHKSAGVAGNNFYIKTANGAQVICNGIKYVDPVTLVAKGGEAGDLTQMNVQMYGTLNDSILDSIAGGQATASFTFKYNPSHSVDCGPKIDEENAFINADGSAIKVKIKGHGYKGGETISVSGGNGVNSATHTGMYVDKGDYIVRVLDENNFELFGPGLYGTPTGYQGAIAGRLIYTHTFYSERGDIINVNGKEFKFIGPAIHTGAEDEILIGADIAATTKNTVEALNKSTDPRVLQATYSSTSNAGEIQATYKAYGNGTDHYFTLGGCMRSDNIIITNATLTGGTKVSGLDVSMITNNPAFIGIIQGFEAEYCSTNRVNLSIKVGEYTYKASHINTLPPAATWVTFISEEDGGGSFKLEMAAGNGHMVRDQECTDTFARRFDNAFSGLKAVQKREISDFMEGGYIKNGSTTISCLLNAKVFFTNDKFEKVKIEDIKFVAPDASCGQTDATVEILINGETYRSASGIGSVIAKGSLLTLYNVNDCNRKVEFLIAHDDLNLSTQCKDNIDIALNSLHTNDNISSDTLEAYKKFGEGYVVQSLQEDVPIVELETIGGLTNLDEI